ncbi:MFS transporter [Amycolatopsis endophytica]|uniref:Putative MFS family arabinose efflux permease n=1 Tax=Amycolatopsis endophytica TaxID=860233 RepID=A0A853BDW1_9PSEU|nr:MFS transporter [Amycolatopsis endophytica]NYI92934.1 putative MFS family arabinose efflux permease [Amycolatopsis endophytica]
MPAWLVVLACAALMFYTDDYIIAGVLPEIAADLHVTVGAAGQLVTVFSVTVAIAAPVLAVLTARTRPRVVLAVAAAVFAAANLAAALTPSFTVLTAARIFAAAAAGAATPSLFALAARLSPPDRMGRNVAVVALGITGAVALGVPAGTWLSALGGWRLTFAALAVAGLVTVAAVLAVLPATTTTPAPAPWRERLRVLGAAPVTLGLSANIVLMFGSMMLLTYLAPFTAGLSEADLTARGALFAVSGVAGMIGIWWGGRATDRWGPDRTLAIGVAAFIASMVVLGALWLIRPVPVLVLWPLVALWGGAAFWNSPAVQVRLHRLAGDESAQALALNTSGTYLGIAIGGAAGGAVIGLGATGALPWCAACAGLVAFLLFHLAARSGGRKPDVRLARP